MSQPRWKRDRIQETVPGGGRIMVWEGERHRECQRDADDDQTYHHCEYRTWALRVWPVGDGRFCWLAELIWIEGNESETLSARGVRASRNEAKAAAIAAVVHRNGEARHES